MWFCFSRSGQFFKATLSGLFSQSQWDLQVSQMQLAHVSTQLHHLALSRGRMRFISQTWSKNYNSLVRITYYRAHGMFPRILNLTTNSETMNSNFYDLCWPIKTSFTCLVCLFAIGFFIKNQFYWLTNRESLGLMDPVFG